MNFQATAEPIAPEYPEIYALRVSAPPSGAGDYVDGDLVTFDTTIRPKCGDVVALHHKTRGTVLITLVFDVEPHVWANMPWTDAIQSTALPLIVGTIIGTQRQVRVKASECWAFHYCTGRLDA